ncbi:ABC-2 type transport system permease protein [Catenulispora sp. GP43]|uniref:ABC transporter permease n=1 Tax=Catenulispora sp. GP43 TaxID=3156263 RepID=UPI0035112927
MTAAPTTGRALHAEWIKIRTLRSTWLTALLAVAVALTFALLGYHSTAHHWPTMTPPERAAYDPVRAGYSGAVDLAVLALGTLGVLTATGEYGTGAIRTTFTATPRRSHVVTAKIAVVGGFSLALGQATAFTIFETGQHLIASTGAQTTLSQPHVARAVLAAGLFLAASALIGLGLGFVIRRTAGALAAFFGLYFLAQLLLGAISDTASKVALSEVFASICSVRPRAGKITPSVPAAFVILAAYVLISCGAAFIAVRRRDA